MRKICIDVQSAIAQRAGVGRYTKLLVEHLDAGSTDHELLLFYFDFRRKGQPVRIHSAREKAVRWCPGGLAQQAWKRIGFPPFDWFSGKADLYHFPNFVIPPLRTGKKVSTIHDVSFLRYPEFAEKKNLDYLRAKIPDTVARADAIITVSQFSAAEIQELLGVDGDRVHVTHLGISSDLKAPAPDVIQQVKQRHALERPYVLFVGTVEPRKNIPFLVDMFEQMQGFDGDLVICGMRGWRSDPILERIRTSKRADRIRWLEYIPDAELPALYAGAELFVMASTYEGFGLPPLEAMACGTPVLSSRGGSLPEIVGGAGTLLADYDAGLWAETALRIICDRDTHTRMSEAGRNHAATFTWSKTAGATWKVYESLL